MKNYCIAQGTLLNVWPKWEGNPQKRVYMYTYGACQVVLVVKNLPADAADIRDTVWSLGQEDPWVRSLAWRILWTEEPAGLQSTGSQRVGHDWSHLSRMHTHAPFYILERNENWNPLTSHIPSQSACIFVVSLFFFFQPASVFEDCIQSSVFPVSHCSSNILMGGQIWYPPWTHGCNYTVIVGESPLNCHEKDYK